MALVNKLDLYCIDLNNNFSERDIAGFQFKLISSISQIGLLDLLLSERGKKYEEVIQARLKAGVFYGFCFVETATNKVVYSRWLRTDTFFHDKYKKKISIKHDEGFTLDSYTATKYRGIGLHAEMNKRMLNYCKNEMEMKKIFMVIFSGKEFEHLHKTVKELGYYKIRSVTRIDLNYIKQFFFKIKKINA